MHRSEITIDRRDSPQRAAVAEALTRAELWAVEGERVRSRRD
jgi:hypothetical protein